MEEIKMFVLMFLVDIIWVRCVWSVNETAFKAAAWSTAFYVVSTAVVLDVVKQPWLILPAAAGAFAGTYATVWWRKRDTSKNN